MTELSEITGVCDQCEAEFEMRSWRWNGEEWEHKCADMHPQAGHCGRLISRELFTAQQRIKFLESELDAIVQIGQLYLDGEYPSLYEVGSVRDLMQRASVALGHSND